MKSYFFPRGAFFISPFDNTIDPFIPEFWSYEGLVVLEQNLVMGALVNRNFENVLQRAGDTVNIPIPGILKAYRKTNSDNVTIQDVDSTNLQVKLDQHIHTSFLIKDGEESLSAVSLINLYLRPAIRALVHFVERMLIGQYVRFLKHTSGQLHLLTGTNAKSSILDARNLMNKLLLPVDGRAMVVTPDSETAILNTDIFLTADKVGDNGTALRKASLGEKLGFQFFMSQHAATIADTMTTVTGAVNHALGYVAGSTATLVVDGLSAAISNNTWLTVDGTPYRVIATTGSGTPVSITLDRVLARDVADNAVIVLYPKAAVNNSGGYAIGYQKEITMDLASVALQVGQAVTFGTDGTSPVYNVIDVNGSIGITLDRPLSVAIADDDNINYAPSGNYNFGILPAAITLVNRPLAPPRVGALSGVIANNNLSLRTTITYNGEKQGHLVTLDMLCGVNVLQDFYGMIMCG